MTLSFNLRRFDFMEAQLSMKFALRGIELPRELLRRVEGGRWMTFIGCYRLYLQHEAEIQEADREALHQRFKTILHTFRPSRLPLRYRWKPGNWLTTSTRMFDLQQRAYMAGRRFFLNK